MVLPDQPSMQREGRAQRSPVVGVDRSLGKDFTVIQVVRAASNGGFKKSGEGERSMSMFKVWVSLVLKAVWGLIAIMLLAAVIAFGVTIGWQLGTVLIP